MENVQRIMLLLVEAYLISDGNCKLGIFFVLKGLCHDNAHVRSLLTTFFLTNINRNKQAVWQSFFLHFFRNKAATRRQELSSRAASNTSSRGHRVSRRLSQIKIQNMRFKSLTNDQTAPRYRYFNFYKPHKVDGKGFFSQMPTLKTVPSDQKSNRRTCAEECQIPFNILILRFHVTSPKF